MQSLLITPKDKAELELISALLSRMNIVTTVFGDDDQEDLGLAILLRKIDRTETISREAIFRQLGQV